MASPSAYNQATLNNKKVNYNEELEKYLSSIEDPSQRSKYQNILDKMRSTVTSYNKEMKASGSPNQYNLSSQNNIENLFLNAKKIIAAEEKGNLRDKHNIPVSLDEAKFTMHPKRGIQVVAAPLTNKGKIWTPTNTSNKGLWQFGSKKSYRKFVDKKYNGLNIVDKYNTSMGLTGRNAIQDELNIPLKWINETYNVPKDRQLAMYDKDRNRMADFEESRTLRAVYNSMYSRAGSHTVRGFKWQPDASPKGAARDLTKQFLVSYIGNQRKGQTNKAFPGMSGQSIDYSSLLDPDTHKRGNAPVIDVYGAESVLSDDSFVLEQALYNSQKSDYSPELMQRIINRFSRNKPTGYYKRILKYNNGRKRYALGGSVFKMPSTSLSGLLSGGIRGGESKRGGNLFSGLGASLIRGPGSGTTDDIEANVKPGSFIIPDATKDAMEKSPSPFKGGLMKHLGNSMQNFGNAVPEFKSEDKKDSSTVPVRLSNGELYVPPEKVQQIGLDKLERLRKATVNDSTLSEDESNRIGFASGGLVPGFASGGKIPGYASGGSIIDWFKTNILKETPHIPQSPTNTVRLMTASSLFGHQPDVQQAQTLSHNLPNEIATRMADQLGKSGHQPTIDSLQNALMTSTTSTRKSVKTAAGIDEQTVDETKVKLNVLDGSLSSLNQTTQQLIDAFNIASREAYESAPAANQSNTRRGYKSEEAPPGSAGGGGNKTTDKHGTLMSQKTGWSTFGWKAASMSMSSMGVYFSMLGIVTMISQGFAKLTGSISDVNKAFENLGYAKAFGSQIAGMEGLLGKLDINSNDLVKTWEKFTGLQAILQSMFAKLAISVFGNEKFTKALSETFNVLFDTLSSPDTITTIVDLLSNLTEAIPDVVAGFKRFTEIISVITGNQGLMQILTTLFMFSLVAQPIFSSVSALASVADILWLVGKASLSSSISSARAILGFFGMGVSANVASIGVGSLVKSMLLLAGVIGGVILIADLALAILESLSGFKVPRLHTTEMIGSLIGFKSGGEVEGYADGGPDKGNVPIKVSAGESLLSQDDMSALGGESKVADFNKTADLDVFQGPGTGTSDSITTSVPKDSFILRKTATDKLRGFALGGFTDGGPSPDIPSVSVKNFMAGNETTKTADQFRSTSDTKDISTKSLTETQMISKSTQGAYNSSGAFNVNVINWQNNLTAGQEEQTGGPLNAEELAEDINPKLPIGEIKIPPLDKIVGDIKGWLKGIGDFFKGLLPGDVKSWLKGIGDFFKGLIPGDIKGWLKGIGDFFKGLIPGDVKGWLKGIGDFFKGLLPDTSGWLKGIGEFFKGLKIPIPEWMKTVASWFEARPPKANEPIGDVKLDTSDITDTKPEPYVKEHFDNGRLIPATGIDPDKIAPDTSTGLTSTDISKAISDGIAEGIEKAKSSFESKAAELITNALEKGEKGKGTLATIAGHESMLGKLRPGNLFADPINIASAIASGNATGYNDIGSTGEGDATTAVTQLSENLGVQGYTDAGLIVGSKVGGGLMEKAGASIIASGAKGGIASSMAGEATGNFLAKGAGELGGKAMEWMLPLQALTMFIGSNDYMNKRMEGMSDEEASKNMLGEGTGAALAGGFIGTSTGQGLGSFGETTLMHNWAEDQAKQQGYGSAAEYDTYLKDVGATDLETLYFKGQKEKRDTFINDPIDTSVGMTSGFLDAIKGTVPILGFYTDSVKLATKAQGEIAKTTGNAFISGGEAVLGSAEGLGQMAVDYQQEAYAKGGLGGVVAANLQIPAGMILAPARIAASLLPDNLNPYTRETSNPIADFLFPQANMDSWTAQSEKSAAGDITETTSGNITTYTPTGVGVNAGAGGGMGEPAAVNQPGLFDGLANLLFGGHASTEDTTGTQIDSGTQDALKSTLDVAQTQNSTASKILTKVTNVGLTSTSLSDAINNAGKLVDESGKEYKFNSDNVGGIIDSSGKYVAFSINNLGQLVTADGSVLPKNTKLVGELVDREGTKLGVSINESGNVVSSSGKVFGISIDTANSAFVDSSGNLNSTLSTMTADLETSATTLNDAFATLSASVAGSGVEFSKSLLNLLDNGGAQELDYTLVTDETYRPSVLNPNLPTPPTPEPKPTPAPITEDKLFDYNYIPSDKATDLINDSVRRNDYNSSETVIYKPQPVPISQTERKPYSWEGNDTMIQSPPTPFNPNLPTQEKKPYSWNYSTDTMIQSPPTPVKPITPFKIFNETEIPTQTVANAVDLAGGIPNATIETGHPLSTANVPYQGQKVPFGFTPYGAGTGTLSPNSALEGTGAAGLGIQNAFVTTPKGYEDTSNPDNMMGLGLRIKHEWLHAQGQPADDMNSNPAFNEQVTSKYGSKEAFDAKSLNDKEKEYYDFLTLAVTHTSEVSAGINETALKIAKNSNSVPDALSVTETNIKSKSTMLPSVLAVAAGAIEVTKGFIPDAIALIKSETATKKDTLPIMIDVLALGISTASGAIIKSLETVVGWFKSLPIIGDLLGGNEKENTTATTKMATGGIVSGPGSETDDKVPTMLSRGEYVVNAKATKQFGIGALNAINSGNKVGGMGQPRPSGTQTGYHPGPDGIYRLKDAAEYYKLHPEENKKVPFKWGLMHRTDKQLLEDEKIYNSMPTVGSGSSGNLRGINNSSIQNISKQLQSINNANNDVPSASSAPASAPSYTSSYGDINITIQGNMDSSVSDRMMDELVRRLGINARYI